MLTGLLISFAGPIQTYLGQKTKRTYKFMSQFALITSEVFLSSQAEEISVETKTGINTL